MNFQAITQNMNAVTVHSMKNLSSTKSYEPMLKDSINHFLTKFSNGGSDFSAFQSIFLRLVETIVDPPLEIIWFYSAMTFHSFQSTVLDPSKKLLGIKNLFQLLVSCSNPCNALKKVAVLSPVVYVLYHLVFDCATGDLFLRREIEGFLERIVSYICMCCSSYLQELDNGLDNLMECFADVIRVWTADRVAESCKSGSDLRVFFPLLNDEIRRGISVSCSTGYLAGIAMNQAFLLTLCLKFGLGVSGEDLQRDTENWTLQTIKGFQNYYFLDSLLRMLLEPSLPVTTLMTSEDAVLLRKMLFDAVILVDYSFLNSGTWTQLPDDQLKDLAIIWSLVVDTAIEFVREIYDQINAISYVNAFSESHLCNQLIKWISNQTGIEEKKSSPNISTPRGFIKWLLVLEDQGLRVFDQNVSKFFVKAVISKSKVDYEFLEFKPVGEHCNGNIGFCHGNEGRCEDKVDGDQEMVDPLNDSFPDAVCACSLDATHGRKKRKEGTGGEGETPVKFVKYNVRENSIGDKFLSSSDDDGLSSLSEVENLVHGLSSGSEVDNPVSDEDMKDMC